jgi:23S rRNA (adenine2503-C2)-methyltransferase
MQNLPQLPMNIIGVSRNELQSHLQKIGFDSYRIDQLWFWLYKRGIKEFAQATNIGKKRCEELEHYFHIHRPEVIKAQISKDGTQKWLLRFQDNEEAEAVHIPEKERGTLCISSQVGCTLTCAFCHTGTQMLVRNLTSAEILGQVMLARDVFNEWHTTTDLRHISNIVMMGMGEPLYNYDHVATALKILMDEKGLSISKRRITLSTSGVVEKMEQCAKELGVNLAISLHAVRDDLRNTLVPINKKYPIKELLDACRQYAKLTSNRRITFEYVMLKGVNDSPQEAKELVHLIRGIPAKINLIPFNPWPGSNFECSDEKSIAVFADYLQKAGYISPVRTPRGSDIMAACGQLKSDSKRKRKS